MATDLDLVLSQPNANVIWWAAWLSLGASFHALYVNQSGFAIVPAGVLFTSLNYWRNPLRNSWRRSVDIGVVFVGLCYQSALAYNMPESHHRRTYFNCIAASGACYALGHLFMWLNVPRAAAYAHAGIHVMANVGNIGLQCGANQIGSSFNTASNPDQMHTPETRASAVCNTH